MPRAACSRAAANLRAAGAADLPERARKVAAVAAAHAAAVDRDSRFPEEAIAAARAERLLGIAVPRELGGEGAQLADVVDVCYALGRACASTAMIYAMHQTTVACLVRHGRVSAWHQLLLRRLCNEQLLLASSTTEGQGGGDVRNSSAPIVRNGSRIDLERQATVISYGQAADAIVTTARRSADAASSDQVLVAFLKADYTLEPLVGWDAFGMRGTCSEGFRLVASGSSEQILPVAYDKIHAQTMMPVAHLCWSGAWTGIATAAVDRARAFVRQAAQRAGGDAAACRRASDARQRHAAHAAQPGRRGAGAVRGGRRRSGRARSDRLPDRHESAQGQRLRARRRRGDERDADLRARGLSQRRRVQSSAAICAISCRRRS